MDERLISIARGLRQGIQWAINPFDWAVREINNKKSQPPLWLRQKVGSLNDFEGSGAEYMAYLKLLCGLTPGMSVLDIGCGCGLLCLDNTENGSILKYLGYGRGRYVGVDIDSTAISWCKRNIEPKYPTARFYNGIENVPTSYRFNLVVCKSLFTHLLAFELESTLDFIKIFLAKGGKILTTWFIIENNEVSTLEGRYTFSYPGVDCWYERGTNPQLAVAYDLNFLKDLFKKFEFGYDIWYGGWRGSNRGLSYQDIIILKGE